MSTNANTLTPTATGIGATSAPSKPPAPSPALLKNMDAYWRAANYLSVGQMYLCESPLLKRPLSLVDVKRMLLGHWGTITTPSDMTVLNEIDRFQRVIDVIDRLPVTSNKGLYLKRQAEERLIEHRSYIFKQGENKPEICNWKKGDLK